MPLFQETVCKQALSLKDFPFSSLTNTSGYKQVVHSCVVYPQFILCFVVAAPEDVKPDIIHAAKKGNISQNLFLY